MFYKSCFMLDLSQAGVYIPITDGGFFSDFGGVTVSTGIVEAVEAYRGSYRPR
jgi:hypothetical protein